jgi:hypothetical protein
VVGIVDLGILAGLEFAGLGGLEFETVVADIAGHALGPRL